MVQFRSLPGEKFKAVLQPDSDKILDLAVLRIEDWGDQGIDAGGVPFDRLGVPDKLKRGADVFHVGNPMGQSWRTNVKPDKISENIGNFLSFESNFITTGHSGGGLFNECWDLVGMIIEDLPPDGKATRIDKIVETLQQWGYPIDLRTDSSRLPCPSDGGNGPTTSNAIGFSLGASSSIANSSDIYIGNESGLYLEGYLKYKLMDIGKRGGYLGIEPSVGVDFREAIPKWLFRGTTAANGFVNLFAGWQGEQTPIQANVGIGVGAVGIFYNYHASDGISDSLGKNYNENRMKLASNLFLEIGFPLPKNLKFRGLLRYIYASGKVDDLPEMKYVDGEDGLIEPQGQITGWYFAGGLEFPFR